MKLSTKRKIYYTSVITALVAILVSAVAINRTLVNTPVNDIESISKEAGEAVSAYMAYFDKNGDMVVGIAEENGEKTQEIIDYVKNVSLGEPTKQDNNETKTADAWIILYDSENRIASRMNFYDKGAMIWYDGDRFMGADGVMETIIEYCDMHIEENIKDSADKSENQGN